MTVAACTLQPPPSVLSGGSPAAPSFDTFFADTAAGQAVKAHVLTSMAYGVDAEARYQASLAVLRAQPGAAEALHATYLKVPEDHYLLRTMLVEALKELRSPTALPFLREIAFEKIQPDRAPENTEIDTRTDEIVIRLTAVEGISLLAAARSEAAEELLLDLISRHEDLTVRQMATRGYLASPFGNVQEKQQRLRRTLPSQEHWYITTERTDIRAVPYPQMPAKFNLEAKRTTNPPEVKKP